MELIDYYKTQQDFNMIDYYTGIKEELNINKEHINTIAEDRRFNEEILNNPDITDRQNRFANYIIMGMTSSASNDIYEEQLSKVFGITNINTKHGWDANDEINNEPYEFKPTKLKKGKNYFGTTVSIRDDNIDIIHHKRNKNGYNNYQANFVIGIIDDNTSEFICIYKFKENILYMDRITEYYKAKERKVGRWCYPTNINKCIELSKKYNEKYYKWHNPKSF